MQISNKKRIINNNKVINEMPIVADMPPVNNTQHVQTAPVSSFKNYFKSNITSFDSSSTFTHKAAEYIKKNEGMRNKLYKDSKGKWTIGIGHLASPEEIKNYSGKTLSDTEVEDIFAKDLSSKLTLVRKTFGDTFDSFPEAVKIAVLDGFFRGDLPGSPRTIELLKAKNYKAAAKEYLNNNEYRAAVASGSGVAGRMQRNAKVYANAR